jgi:translation initiation factor IF-2
MERGWVTENYGGDVPLVCVSGLTGEGLPELIETVALQAEVLELSAENSGHAEGVVLESTLEKGHGAVADVLINWGKLSVGDVVVAGTEFGRVKRLLGTQKNDSLSEAGPSRAVRVVGLKVRVILLMIINEEDIHVL